MRTTITLALCTALLATALQLSDSALAGQPSKAALKQNERPRAPGTKATKGKPAAFSWQPKQYATDNDMGNLTGGPAKAARGFSWGVKPVSGGGRK
jgi:hypothetical protein